MAIMCDCGQMDLIFDSSTYSEVCKRCGVVVDTVLCDDVPYEFDGVGNSTSFHGAANVEFLGTMIDTGRHLHVRMQASLMDKMEIKIVEMQKLIKEFCINMYIQVPSAIHDTAVDISRKFIEKNHVSGEKKRGVYAMSIFFACRINNAEREIRMFSKMCSLDIKTLNFAVKVLKEFLADHPQYSDKIVETNSVHNALVDQYLSRLIECGSERKMLWKETMKTIERVKLAFDSGKKPRSIVISIIYLSSIKLRIPMDKKFIVDSCGVCVQTLDKTLNMLDKEFDIKM